MRRSLLSLIALAVAFLISPVTAAGPLEGRHAEKLRAFEQLARAQMAHDKTTGLVIGLMLGDDTWVRAFGLADVEIGTPMKPESSFRMASVTKPMTAVGVLQLVEKGKLDLDAEVQTYVPYFPRKQHPVTVRQLLGHLGGISHYRDDGREGHIKEKKTTREALAIFQDFDLVAEPGTRYSYTSYGYNLLGAAIEGASGQGYGDYMKEHVWAPIGMNDTRMDDPREIIPNRVRGYDMVDGRLLQSEFIDISSRFAGGGTRSTVPDLLKLARGFVDGRLVSKATVDLMTQPMVLRNGHYTNYGLGWGSDPQNGRYVIAHSGAQNETRTVIYIAPARRLAVAAASNFESADLRWYVSALVAQVLGELWNDSGGFAFHAPDPIEAAQLASARNAFHFGLAAYEKRGAALSEDPARLRAAFAELGRCVDPERLRRDAEKTRTECADALHPVHGETLVVAGSYMAKVIADARGADSLERYHATGALPFLADYAELSRKRRKEVRLPAALDQRLARWQRDWARTADPSVLPLVVSPDAPPDERHVREAFAGASVYPDRVTELGELSFLACRESQRERSLDGAALVKELYPTSAEAAAYVAAAHACFGDLPRARQEILSARGLTGGARFTGPRYLNGLAYDLAGVGRLDGATGILRIAIDLHPKEASLNDSLGELERRAGRREAAIAAYRRALEIDPKLESSRRALEELEKEAH